MWEIGDDEDYDYNLDTDYNGSRGIALADSILRKKGHDLTLNFTEKKDIKDIIKLTPKQISNSPHVNSIVKKDLENLSKEGYSIDARYKKMDSISLWNYYIKTLSENHYFEQPQEHR